MKMLTDGRTTTDADGRRRTTNACLYYKLTYEPSAQVRSKWILLCSMKIEGHDRLFPKISWMVIVLVFFFLLESNR